jgi:hypothetical protein
MANITLRPSTNWSEALLHWFDVVLDLLERRVRRFFVDKHSDFRQAAHVARVRRLAAHGCNGQALM